ncbi:MAG: FAD-dependent oxidoreductase [Anaerolineales bacterium]
MTELETRAVCLPGGERPVLWAGDVVVAGASFAGLSAALALAGSGRRVAIIEPRTYPGRELTATQRPWLLEDVGSETPLIASCLALPGNVRHGGEVALHPDQLKIYVEDVLAAAGVELFYATHAVGLLTGDGAVQGLVVANKSGRQVLLASVLVDATETALLARLAGAKVAPDMTPTVYRRTLEFGGVGEDVSETLDVPATLGLVGNRVECHRGVQGAGHCYVDYAVAWPRRATTMPEAAALKASLEATGLALTVYLRDHVLAFAPPAIIGFSSYEPAGPLCGPLSAGASLPEGLWLLNESSADGTDYADARAAARRGEERGRQIAECIRPPRRSSASATEPLTGGQPSLTVREQSVPQRGRAYPFAVVPEESLPVVLSRDILVVGGGSSGAMAAIVAVEEGASAAVVDMNPGLGGTGTYGGINTYWFARRFGFVDRLMGWLDEIHDRLYIRRPQGVMAHWNVEARVQALREQAERAGVKTLLNALAFGAVLEGQHVRGVAAATPYGPVVALGRVVLDATGDADVAAWAGAEATYGSAREHVVMWGYMPQLAAPDQPRNVKTSMVDTTNIADYNRMIRAERRRAGSGDYDHGVYLAPRESRHIQAEVVMTLTDQLTRRCWPDVAYIAFSNYDMKGEATSDWVRMGLQPPNLTMEISYRSLVPKGVEDILVVGKAFAATHDGVAAPRMQPDMENLGGVGAVAAALALRERTSVRALNVRHLQERLVGLRVLPADVLTRQLAPLRFTRAELERQVAEIDGKRPLADYSAQEIGEPYPGRVPEVDVMCAGPEAIPVLEAALATAAGRRKTRLAQMLCVLGSRAGVEHLVGVLHEAFSGSALPDRPYKVMHQGPPPDQGADTEEAHLLTTLAMAGDDRILPLWQRVVDLLDGTTREDIFDPAKDRLGYAAAVAYGAERLGDPRAVPILRQLHSYPLFGGLRSTSGQQADWFLERLAYGELLTGRALARCGSPEGFIILINYLEDVRASLAEHAHEELISITGEDYGKDVSAWAAWLEQTADQLEPRPYHATPEPVAAWRECILVEADAPRPSAPQA